MEYILEKREEIRNNKGLERFIKAANTCAYICFCAVIFDCAFSGSGHWLEFFGITPRMMCCGLSILLVLPTAIKNIRANLCNPVHIILMAFALLLIIDAVRGIRNGNNREVLLSDLKGFMHLFLVPVAMNCVTSKKRIGIVMELVLGAALCQSLLVHCFYISAALSDDTIMPIALFMSRIGIGSLSVISENVIRLFTKSSPYIIVACAICVIRQMSSSKIRFKYIVLVAVYLSALLLSFTRSLFLSAGITAIAAIVVAVAVDKKQFFKMIRYLAVTLLAFFLILTTYEIVFEANILNYAISRTFGTQVSLSPTSTLLSKIRDRKRIKQLEIQVTPEIIQTETPVAEDDVTTIPTTVPVQVSTEPSNSESNATEEINPSENTDTKVPTTAPTQASTETSNSESNATEEINPSENIDTKVPTTAPTQASTETSNSESNATEEINPSENIDTEVPTTTPTQASTETSNSESNATEEINPSENIDTEVPATAPTQASTETSNSESNITGEITITPTFVLESTQQKNAALNRQEHYQIITQQSDNLRKNTQNDLMLLFLENPLFGNGLGAVSQTRQGADEYFYHDILARMGIVGLVLYVLPYVYVLCCTVKAQKKLIDDGGYKLAALVSVIAFFVATAFNPWMNAVIGISWYAVALAAPFIIE